MPKSLLAEFEEDFNKINSVPPDDKRDWSKPIDQELDDLGEKIKVITIKHALWGARWALEKASKKFDDRNGKETYLSKILRDMQKELQ